MMTLCRMFAIAFLCAMLSGPSLQAQPSGSGPALGVARISLVRNEVAVQRGESEDSIQAQANLPLVEGDYLTTGPGSRAEVQLDYSNLLRLDELSSVRLASLGNRSFLIQIERGTVTYSELRGGDADVDIETPLVAVRPQKRGRYRIEVASVDEVMVTVRKGSAEVASTNGRKQLGKGGRLFIRAAAQGVEFQRARAYPKDDWDLWNEQRDRQLTQSKVYSYVNRSVYGAEDLEGHGRWVYVPRYGRCWFPSVMAGWAPYRHGRWVWLDYYGWSWVSYDPWGWAPYHYGRWFRHARHGWGWYPGSFMSHHPWRPALVAFFGYNGPRVSAGASFGHYGWIPLAPDEPYYPWFGGRNYGSGRGESRNTILVDNSTNIYNNYRNARHRDGITLVDAKGFSRGKIQSARSLKTSELRQAKVMRGRVPVVPDRSSQGKLIRKAESSIRGASKPVRFYSTGTPRRSIIRSSFSRQQQEMTKFVRSGITAGQPGGRANVRSSAKDGAPLPTASSPPRGKLNSRPAVKSSGRSAGKATTIRSSGQSAGRSGQRKRTLTNRIPAKGSAPAATRSRPGSSRSAGRPSSPAPKSAPRVSTRPSRSPSSRPSVPAPRSSSKRSSGLRPSSSRRPRPPAKSSVRSGQSDGRSGQRGKRLHRRQSTEKPPSRVTAPVPARPRPGSSRSAGRSRSPAPKSTPRVNTRRSRSPSSRPSVSVPRSSSKRSSGIRPSSPRKPRTPAERSVTSGSRRSVPKARSSPSRASSGSSGRSSSKKISTRSRRSSKSDDRSPKKRSSGKR